VDYTLELIVVPVSDVDRAKAFYVDKVGFDLLVDHSAGDDFRVVQLVPPGSACAIAIGTGLGHDMKPGSIKGLHLCVSDIEGARAELVERGVEVSEPFHFGANGKQPGIDPARQDYATFVSFDDPDGNGWLVQHVARTKSQA
jgi:catechol 2,3-dioxygenase-like lactoylglutathione lyase family enzyme